MNAWDIATVVAIVSLAGTLVKVVADYTVLKTDHRNLEKKVGEQSENIKELYDSRNKTNETLVQLATIMTNLVDQNKNIEKKIDELKEKIAK